SFTGSAVIFTLDKTAPITASVTAPTAGSALRAATVPASFTGSTADNNGGVGLNANSTTFILQRNADNFYWTGSAWQAAVSNLATTHSATTSNTAAAWTSSATLPTWALESDGVYTVQATATDKVGNTFTGAAVSFTLDKTAPAWTSSATLPTWASESDGVYTVQATATDKVGNTFTGNAASFTLDKTAPITASVTGLANGGIYGGATVPASFSGAAADNNGGVGLNANSTTFTLQRGSDNFYWTGSAWQAGVFNLTTTHSATTSNTAAAWTSSATMPAWTSQTDGTYRVQAKATNKTGNTVTGTA